MPYWRLSAFYGFYFATLGALVPYWGLYLRSQGHDAAAIGELMAILMGTKIVAPNIWGWIADHTGRSMPIVRFGSLAAVVAYGGVFWAQGYWPMAAVMLVYSFFWNAVLPQFEVTTLGYLGSDAHRYANVRLWGSVGFIVAVAALGPAIQMAGPQLVPYVVLLLFIGIWLASLSVAERGTAHHHHEHEPLARVLLRPKVLALLAVCFLMQASHGPYYTFYTIYLDDHGYGETLIGQLWALGVVAEVAVFLVMARLVARFGLGKLLLAAMLLTALRWLLIGYAVEQLGWLLLAQTLHAASFGVFHAVAIALFHRFFTGRNQGRGQALYSSMSFGAGGAVGALASGLAWDGLGPAVTHAWAAGAAALGAWVTWRWLRHD